MINITENLIKFNDLEEKCGNVEKENARRIRRTKRTIKKD